MRRSKPFHFVYPLPYPAARLGVYSVELRVARTRVVCPKCHSSRGCLAFLWKKLFHAVRSQSWGGADATSVIIWQIASEDRSPFIIPMWIEMSTTVWG
jgi:hypothetical protein